MSLNIYKTEQLTHTLFKDALILAAICIVPAVSHIIAFPLYKLNPMLFFLLLSMLLVRDRRNAFLMAVLIPTVSMLVTGMPAPMKGLCMIAELLTVVGTYQFLYHKLVVNLSNQLVVSRSNRLVVSRSIFVSILAGKMVFYALKALLVESGGHLIGTAIWLQMAVMVVFSLLFAVAVSKR